VRGSGRGGAPREEGFGFGNGVVENSLKFMGMIGNK